MLFRFYTRGKQPNRLGIGVLLGHFHHSAKNPGDSPVLGIYCFQANFQEVYNYVLL